MPAQTIAFFSKIEDSDCGKDSKYQSVFSSRLRIGMALLRNEYAPTAKAIIAA
jgi:hypothetical protein